MSHLGLDWVPFYQPWQQKQEFAEPISLSKLEQLVGEDAAKMQL